MRTWLLLAACLPLLAAACPNACSGHGDCSGQTCSCFTGWTEAPDCSQRTCPTGAAWADKPSGTNTAHATGTECSNAGLCNRATGICECFSGFTGDACQRATCANDCSGHGKCVSQAVQALLLARDASTGAGYTYTNWDADVSFGCVCDLGFTGPTCSLKMCPKGDDPQTTGQVDHQITVTTAAASGVITGTFELFFNGESIEFDASQLSDADCTTAFSTLPNVDSVTCTAVNGANGGATYTLTFAWPLVAAENNLFTHDGSPDISAFACGTASATGDTVTCAVAEQTQGTKEYAYCALRGVCDFATGLCKCQDGYEGATCDTATAVITTSDDPGLHITVTDNAYVGTELLLETSKAAGNDFYHLRTVANNVDLFSVLGNGKTTVHLNGLEVENGGSTIAGGMLVSSGGATILASGLKVIDGGATVATTANADNLLVTSSDGSFTNTIVTASADRAASTAFSLFKGVANSATVMDILGNGAATFANGATLTAGGLTVVAGGATVAGGLEVADTGANVVGGVTVADSGLTVTLGGATVTHAATNEPAMQVTASSGSYTDSVLQVSSPIAATNTYELITATANGATVFNVRGDGKTDVGAGLDVASGGATIGAGGLDVSGGATVASGGFTVTGGATVSTGALAVTDGTTSLAQTAANADALDVHASDGSFVRDVALLRTTRAANTAFNMIHATANSADVFTVAGDGSTRTLATTASTSKTTGALRVDGGAGVNLALYWGTKLSGGDDTDATSTQTGALTVIGGVGITRALHVGSTLDAGATEVTTLLTTSTATLNSADVSNAATVGTTLAVDGIATFSSATASTSTASGAIVLSGANGGLGVAGAGYFGGAVVAQNNLIVGTGSSLATVAKVMFHTINIAANIATGATSDFTSTSFTGLAVGDIVTAAPSTAVGGSASIVAFAYCHAANSVTVRLSNPHGATYTNTQDWNLVAIRAS